MNEDLTENDKEIILYFKMIQKLSNDVSELVATDDFMMTGVLESIEKQIDFIKDIYKTDF
ncbi:hypothetical protein [Candidatus Enterococcus clewellii]|uniref:Uncharacterized protein n=1 Tax=Candidatus Enterococcus clewellii TaxID=1834193 RepID=A0A242K7Y2_9ENTE|nr:hypothetical protein [Enterococcus sp. 9E7_DIV0242]OTP17273.1 hypothetical protein A5888_001411 [Enterococcus sp. 9E7_DIV0242]